jgi:maltose O-acetyltransferase
VTVGARTLIGLGAVVLPGIVIGSDCIIGAGSVVVRDVPDGATVYGNPARPRAK